MRETIARETNVLFSFINNLWFYKMAAILLVIMMYI